MFFFFAKIIGRPLVRKSLNGSRNEDGKDAEAGICVLPWRGGFFHDANTQCGSADVPASEIHCFLEALQTEHSSEFFLSSALFLSLSLPPAWFL